jgi:arylsulfatase A-like enzyme/Flp pilus assembly protein TadD
VKGSCVWTFFCLLAIGCAAVMGAAPKPQPDVFLITIDTLRADHVHCYGYDRVQTPTLDALAKDGIRFAEGFTPNPVTNTSHASILTGLLPGSHGVTDFAVPLSASHLTIAELLHAQGYHTAAFIGAVILDSKTLAPGFDRGFDFYDNFPGRAETRSRWGRLERRGREVVQHAEDWLDKNPSSPHFLWVHLYDPHDPYEPPEPFSEMYKDHLYDGEIAYADSALGNFVAYLKKTARYDGSIIVVVGDHGEGLGEHHEDTHGIFLYDSTTHVPLIIKLPAGRDAGMIIGAQVRTIDIVPTLLELTTVASPPKMDGTSLTAYFGGTDHTDRPAYGETDYPLRFGWAPLRSVRTDGFKFIEAPRPELYDIRLDAAELQNTYNREDARVKKSRAMLAEVRAREGTEQDTRTAGVQPDSKQLKALGFTAAPSISLKNPVGELPDPKDKIEEANLLHAAMLASEGDRPGDARRSLLAVLALDPKSPTALQQLGELELSAGNYAQASQHLKDAMEVRPDDATAAFEAGRAMEMTHDLAGARDALEAGLKLMPEDFGARVLLGRVCLQLKDPKSAEDQFEAALLLQSDSTEAQLGLATAQIDQDRFTEAVGVLQPLSKAEPNNAEVFELLAKAYSGLGKKSEAQQAETRYNTLRGSK